MRMRLISTAALFIATAAVAGCGGSSYGSTPLVGSSGGQVALGSGTPTPTASAAPAQTAAQTPPAQTSAPVATPRPTPPPTQKAAGFDITINGDNTSQPQFSPPAAKVYTGTVITFTNHDSVPRSVVSDNSGVFDSGPIPPGGTWKYTAATVGTFNYHDGTRPYAVAYFQVVSP
jgi:plastocyanin